MLGELLAAVRSQGSSMLRGALAGEEGLQPSEMASVEDLGLYGPDSVVWRVHGDSAMLIGGLRSLMLQTLHPLAMAGVAEHSDYKADPWGRLNRTGRFVGATTYGSTETAERAIEIVRRVHKRVTGIAPDGRPYAANDPHLLLWVHITEVDSFLRAYERYGEGRLRDAEKDQYVAEMAEVARRLGSEEPPESVAELAACMDAFRSECKGGPQARETLRFLLFPPVPLVLRGPYGVLAAGAITLLPGWARRELRLPVLPLVDPLAVRPAAMVLTRAIGWLMAADPREIELTDRLLVE
jgi:uncharacterized protein (DUF2236 family)